MCGQIDDEQMRNTKDCVQVRVPASTANLGPGFDTIGMALQLYTTIRMTISDHSEVRGYGKQLEGLPTDKTNLVYQMAEFVYEKAKLKLPSLLIEVKSDIPLARGLGSSAAAIVGGLVAANHLAGEPFSKEEVLQMATEIEGHPDNVGAALFGGILVAVLEDNHIPHLKITPDLNLKTIVVIPDFQLSTEQAREVLPKYYSRADAVYSVGHASLLVAALACGQYDVLDSAMKDKLHQPYRMDLVPGLEEVLQGVHEYNALGAALSGAGPTIIALLWDNEESLGQFMQSTLLKYGINSTVMSIQPDYHGAQLQPVDIPFITN